MLRRNEISKTKLTLRWIITIVGWIVTIPAGIVTIVVGTACLVFRWIFLNTEETLFEFLLESYRDLWDDYRWIIWRPETFTEKGEH